jgi:hypothetical protein
MSLQETARGYLRDATTAFNRAPAEVALAVLSAVLLSYAIEGEYRFEAWLQMAVGIFIVFAAAWTGTLLHAMGSISLRNRWALTIAGALVAFVYLLVGADFTLESEVWRAFMLVVGTALLVFGAPAWSADDAEPSLRLRRINGRFILRTLGIGLYGLALFGGLALALAAIDNLFELKLKGQIYAHVFGWIMLVLVPWVIVGGLDSYLEPLDRVSDVARVVHRLASFLVPPLIVLYYGILFVYAVRIITTGEMPKNLVSPMVLAAGLLTAVAAILFDPRPGETRAGSRVLRVTPLLFLPLVPLGFWALGTRINEYGWTEFLVRRRPFGLRVIPALLGVTLLLAAVGPWSILAFAKRDQQARLSEALRAANVTAQNATPRDTARKVIPRELYDRINNTAQYLQSHFGDDAVPLGGDGYNFADRLGLRPAINDTLPSSLFGTLPPGTAVLTEVGTVLRIAVSNLPVQVRDGMTIVTIRPGLTADIAPVMAHMQVGPMHRREQRRLPGMSVPVLDAAQVKRGDLVVLEAVVEQRRDSVRVTRLEGILILR